MLAVGERGLARCSPQLDRGMAHRVDRVRLVIVNSETKPLPTTPVIETLPRYELYIWSMQARDNNKTCAAATVAQSAWFGVAVYSSAGSFRHHAWLQRLPVSARCGRQAGNTRADIFLNPL